MGERLIMMSNPGTGARGQGSAVSRLPSLTHSGSFYFTCPIWAGHAALLLGAKLFKLAIHYFREGVCMALWSQALGGRAPGAQDSNPTDLRSWPKVPVPRG